MKKVLTVVLAVASIAGVVQFAAHSKPLQSNVLVADGSDPMPLCRPGHGTCPK